MKRAKPRFQEIKFDNNGNSFITYYGTKYILSEFMKGDIIHNGVTYNGYLTLSNMGGLLVAINNSGDSAKVTMSY